MTLPACRKGSIKTTACSPYRDLVTLAVAPVLNFSGSEKLDTIKVTDILYSELQQVDGIAVVPVNRVLAQMAQDGLAAIQTPEQAVALANRVGAQAIVVSAVTEYNSYHPPIVGFAVQIFGFQRESGPALVVDPVGLQRTAAPIRLSAAVEKGCFPKSQINRIYNARDRGTVAKVKRFAESRGTGTSPYGWELYLRSQEYYLRFVCQEALSELFAKESMRLTGPTLSDGREYH